jgi:hypothetical protein
VGVVLVYDIGNRETFDALCDWMLRIKESMGWQWQRLLCTAVWGNNRDTSYTSISQEQVKAFVSHFDLCEEDFHEVDAHSGHNVFESYQSLIEKIHTCLALQQRKDNDNVVPLCTENTDQDRTGCIC